MGWITPPPLGHPVTAGESTGWTCHRAVKTMKYTKADVIATLRSRNVKGPLTKYKKARLLELLKETAPP